MYYVCGVSGCSILVSFFVLNPRVMCACTFGGVGMGEAGGERGDAIDIIEFDVNGSPGGSLTFPFVGPRDALGNRVIRFRPCSLARLHRFLLDLRCLRGLRTPPRGMRTILLNKTGCFVLHPRLHLACSLTLCKKVRQRRPRPFSPRLVRASQLQTDDHRTFTSRRYRGNFVQTQIIRCRCSRKRLSGGIRNYMLNQEEAFWQIICKYVSSA